MAVLRSALLWGSNSSWLERQFRQRRFARRAVSRFMPGEDLASALKEAGELRTAGISTIITNLGENVESPEEAEAAAEQYVLALEEIRKQGLDCHISVKPTHLGLNDGAELYHANLVRLAEEASRRNNFVWVDMESSEYVDSTLRVFRNVRASHPNVGICVQAYLRRSAEDVEQLLSMDAAIRLVKGAYQESAEIAFPKKAQVDDNFRIIGTELLRHGARNRGQRHAIATHDIRLIAELHGAARDLELSPATYEFQMLYGIAVRDQRRLVGEGAGVRTLISYGEGWFPWYMRRLAERPANVWFVVKSMLRI